jgi:hypothetical protein
MKMAVLGNYEMTAITTNSEEDGGRSQPLASEDIKINYLGYKYLIIIVIGTKHHSLYVKIYMGDNFIIHLMSCIKCHKHFVFFIS